jgi:mono/diheme cytochrome c family protein
LESETDRYLKMVQLDSKPVTIDKSTIVSRSSMHASPMPTFERVLGPEQLANLTAWLMTQRSL